MVVAPLWMISKLDLIYCCVVTLGECLEKYGNEDRYKHASRYNNADECVANNGLWVNFHNYLEISDQTEEECNGDNVEWAIPYRSEQIDQLTGIL